MHGVSNNFFIKWAVIAPSALGSAFFGFYFFRTHLPLSLKYAQEGVGHSEEWAVSFGQEVRIARASIMPPVAGKWYVKNGIFGASSLKFKPSEGFVKGAEYHADIALVRTYDDQKNIAVPQIKFLVAPAPGVVSLLIDEGKGKVMPRPTIELIVGEGFSNERIVPSIVGADVSLGEEQHGGRRFVWRPEEDLPQGTRLTFQAKDGEGMIIIERNFETVTEPKISDFSVKEPIFPGDTIKVSFNVPMVATSTSIVTDISGTGAWIDSLTYEYAVRGVSGGKTYTIKLLAGARSQEGGVVTQDDVRAVAAPGHVVASFFGISRERGVQDPIEVSFDQPVDKESAEKAFRISPTAKGTFSWQGENLIFTPTRLAYQKKYTVSIDSGIKAKYGLPSEEKMTASFTTAPEVFKLTVPYFKQEYSRSCEAASLHMALAYHGITTNDMEIIQKAGYNPRSKDKEKNEWDDPHEMFVGDASKDNGEGYGMYREPLAKSAEAFGRSAYAVSASAITPQFLAKNVRAGYPVVVWGYISSAGPKVTWNMPSGGEAIAIADEHARLIVGVYGSAEDPVGFYLHDPLSGKQYEYWDADKLITHLNAVPGVTNQAVVVK